MISIDIDYIYEQTFVVTNAGLGVVHRAMTNFGRLKFSFQN